MIKELDPFNYDKGRFNSNELIVIAKINEMIDVLNTLKSADEDNLKFIW